MDDLHAPELVQRQCQLFRVNLRSMLGAEELEILTLFGGHNQKKILSGKCFSDTALLPGTSLSHY